MNSSPGSQGWPTEHAQRVIASYVSYRQAEHALGLLPPGGVPIERTAIAGVGIQPQQHDAGWRTYSEHGRC